ncbi:MAG: murein biosynthesis integral membrane protein MurJ [Actinomycetales bacterium mxb001]|nr:MAG: murein biosynthesis integral membrane protein MurJ [Actinomycetales bacterium mxb001]
MSDRPIDPGAVGSPQGPAEQEFEPTLEPVPPTDTALVAADNTAVSEEETRASTRGLIGSSAVMATGTVISRVTGVLRDVAMTAALGFYLVSDAYSLGNTMPNVLYVLIIGGALNAVFIPQLVRHMKDDSDSGAAYADRLITLAGLVLLLFSIAAVIAAPLLVDLYATSAYGESQRELASAFARLCLPQIFFYGIYALFGQVLNSRGVFGPPMFAPILNNIIAIATFLLFLSIAGTAAAADGNLTPDQVAILGIGTTLGVALQALILIPFLLKAGYRWRPRFDWKGAGLGKAGHLAVWTLLLVVVNQAGYIAITRLATLANVNAAEAGTTAAGLTTYQKAHLIFMLPHSVITVSIVTALLPALSRIAYEGRYRQVGADVGGAMRLVAALIVPIAAVLMVTGPTIARLLFGYGAATVQQAELTGAITSIFMLGLLPFTLFYVLFRGFYAIEDTRTPFIVSVVMNVVALGVAIPLFYSVSGGAQIGALALGYVFGFWATFILSWILLSRRLGGLESWTTIRALIRMLLAGFIALCVMVGVQALLTTYVTQGSTDVLPALLIVVVLTLVGSGIYLAGAWAMRISEVNEVVDMVRRRVFRRSVTTT